MASYEKNLLGIKEHLKNGETIIASVMGAYESKILGSDTVKNGILVVTENRVVFYGKKLFNGYDMESFPLSNISSIEKSKGFMGSSITVYTSGNSFKLKWINKGDIEKFSEYINSKIGKPIETKIVATLDTITKDDKFDKLNKLAELKKNGIITDEEFEQEKKKILST